MDSSSKNDPTLLKKLQSLQQENEQLRKENTTLKKQLGIPTPIPEKQVTEKDGNPVTSSFNKYRPSEDKIELYLSLFKGRKEVFAKRWENYGVPQN